MRPGCWAASPATGWHWAKALADLGHEVTVLTMSNYREAILAAGPERHRLPVTSISPTSPLRNSRSACGPPTSTSRWQDAALRHVEAKPQRNYDVIHHVTWGSLHLGSALWRLPAPLVYGPIGGGQTAPANYWRYFGRDWPAETLRTAATGSLLKLNRRCRDAIRHSAVTLVCNSATAAACSTPRRN